MVKILFYFSLAIVVLIAIYLSVFELLLHAFHTPLSTEIKDPLLQEQTWTYLIYQKYLAFIDLDAFNVHEKRHLLDVKRIFNETYILWIISTILSFLILSVFFKKIINILIYLGLISNSLLLFFSLNFINSFNFLHTLVFPNNSWIFAKESLLIQCFPLIYFQEFFILFLIFSSLLFLFIYKLKTYSFKQPN